MRRSSKIMSTALAASVSLSFLPALHMGGGTVNAAMISINETNFPDPVFRGIISSLADEDGDGQLDVNEMRTVQELDVSNKGITSLKGIEYFEFLSILNCSHNELTSLDMESNELLQSLNCSENHITSLKVSGLGELERLDCHFNELSSIDLEGDGGMVWLDVRYNSLSSIDLEECPDLYCFMCRHNNISQLDVSMLCGMQYLWIDENPLTSIDVRDLSGLKQLGIGQTNITELDISENPLMNNLSVPGAGLSVLDISHNPNLLYLQCQDNNLTTLDLTGHDNLLSLECSDNDLTSIDVTRCSGLWMLDVSGNDLSSSGLDISNNPKLMHLRCYGCGLGQIDIRNNPIMIDTYKNGDSRYGYQYPGNTHAYCHDYTDEHGNDFVTTFIIDGTMGVVADSNGPTHRVPSVPEGTSPDGTPSYGIGGEEAIPTPVITPRAAGRNYGTGVEGFVGRLYGVALGRDGDPQGIENWIATIRSGENTGADVARGFLYSPEFLNKDATNEEFVRVLYRTFFDREADEGGLAAWVGVLDSGTPKEEVIEGFINSAEWANVCVSFGIPSGGTGTATVEAEPNQQTIGFATRLYTTCLGRDADEAGLMAWARQLANQRDTGTGAARGFFFSSEFTNQNVSNGEYVARLYRTFMGREADQAGFDAWVGQLDSGTSREEVFNGFAQSQEFGQICASYGIIR